VCVVIVCILITFQSRENIRNNRKILINYRYLGMSKSHDRSRFQEQFVDGFGLVNISFAPIQYRIVDILKKQYPKRRYRYNNDMSISAIYRDIVDISSHL